mmetsp:Transcript_23594/g.54930  ORF Transcript_23594/g.54930 Transcript_23594/m.54930 type:complete len:375 (-) Transcript_23594:117-1241(-)|eukprot:CAMPEP_0178415100 /NCGR_PEP_ID=MMETSP0689_2-20121128/23377_1 /TAXON_ID=160604 /ORGANISM="Amphidinium massartii, Strain CS-259" /LENGTH=374 /DNA_ID=CAMNT_0020036409 /DNA_START=25 /DNA_END=1149 /DNA_ORIENTATION=-
MDSDKAHTGGAVAKVLLRKFFGTEKVITARSAIICLSCVALLGVGRYALTMAIRGFQGPVADRCEPEDLATIMAKSLQYEIKYNRSLAQLDCIQRASMFEILDWRLIGRTGRIGTKSKPLRPRARYQSCAVVGSATHIMGSKHGESIDQNDIVFRMNHHASKFNNMQDTGCKTTFHGFHPGIAYLAFDEKAGILHRPSIPLLLEPDDWSRSWLDCYLDGEPTCPCAFNRMNATKDFMNSIIERFGKGTCTKRPGYLKKREDLEALHPWWAFPTPFFDKMLDKCQAEGELHKRPSAGFQMVMLALSMCDDIELYGMIPPKRLPDGRPEGVSEREELLATKDYFKLFKLRRSEHDFAGESKFYQFLHSLGVLVVMD